MAGNDGGTIMLLQQLVYVHEREMCCATVWQAEPISKERKASGFAKVQIVSNT